MLTLPVPSAVRASVPALLAALAASSALACGGVQVGGRTLVAPVARPALPDRPSAPAMPATGSDLGPDHAIMGSNESARGIVAAERLAPAPTTMAARAASGCFVADRRPLDRTPPSDGPVDPWRAVDGGRPRVLPHVLTPSVDREAARCDAAHDHCLLDCGWIVTTDVTPMTRAPSATERFATADGFDGLASTDDFVAYRSLPVTRRNLDVGALVLVGDELPRPGSEWLVGRVESVDWDEGSLHLDGQRRAYDLAHARLAVLGYRRGGEVHDVAGLDDARLAVRADELILPR